MSDYELLSLYHEAITVFFTAVTILLSLVFSYLVAMFFIAHRLGIALFVLLNVLFAAATFALSGALVANGRRAALMGQELVVRAAQPVSAIDFLQGPLYIPPDMPTAMTWFVRAAIVMSITYAVMHRRAERRARSGGGPTPRG